MPSMTFLDESGDVALTWDDDTRDKMIDIIQKKMDAGYIFYVIEQEQGEPIARKIQITDIKQLESRSSVVIKEDDIVTLLLGGDAQIAESKVGSKITPKRKAKSAVDAAANDTVAIKARRGG